jgi:hypothetical protein
MNTGTSLIFYGTPSEFRLYHENSPTTGTFKFRATYLTDIYTTYLLSQTPAPLLSRDVAADADFPCNEATALW